MKPRAARPDLTPEFKAAVAAFCDAPPRAEVVDIHDGVQVHGPHRLDATSEPVRTVEVVFVRPPCRVFAVRFRATMPEFTTAVRAHAAAVRSTTRSPR